jgi:AcrR family transcriptional regulator
MAGVKQRRTVHRMPAERRVADIMTAARAVLRERGANEAFISEVAERAGVVEGSIYRFFSSKRDLVEKVAEAWYEETLADYSAQFEGVRGVRNQLRFIIHHHLATIKREPALSRIVFQEFRPAESYRQTRLFALNQTYTQRVSEVVKAAAASGEFRRDLSASLARDLIFGGIEHRVWAFLRNEGDFDVGRTAEDRLSAALSRIEAVADRLETAARPKVTRGAQVRK